ncbi:MAG: hypothetical protein J0L51_13320 [Rhizobiales bacterium]|nr:hypothetical protein [Hyphomicrobiales bacterium]
MRLALIAALVFGFSASARAQNCAENFEQDGVPLVTAITYKSWQVFPGVTPAQALDRLARATLAEGFLGMRVDKQYGAITAHQETSGSGRMQTLRVVARKAGNGTRVDAVFQVQAGQVAAAEAVRKGICNVVRAARG